MIKKMQIIYGQDSKKIAKNVDFIERSKSDKGCLAYSFFSF